MCVIIIVFFVCRSVQYVLLCPGATRATRAPTFCSIFSTGTSSPTTHLWWGDTEIYMTLILRFVCYFLVYIEAMNCFILKIIYNINIIMDSYSWQISCVCVCIYRTTVLTRKQHFRPLWPFHCLRTERNVTSRSTNSHMWTIQRWAVICLFPPFHLSLYLSSALYFWATHPPVWGLQQTCHFLCSGGGASARLSSS